MFCFASNAFQRRSLEDDEFIGGFSAADVTNWDIDFSSSLLFIQISMLLYDTFLVTSRWSSEYALSLLICVLLADGRFFIDEIIKFSAIVRTRK